MASHMKKKFVYDLPGMHEHDGVLHISGCSKSHLDKLKETDFKDGDLMLATYPKSGTTWMQEIMYLIQNGADVKEAKNRPPMVRVPFMELEALWPMIQPRKSPRLLKTHLQSHYFQRQIENNKVKVVFVTRNPKDTLASYYHFYQKMEELGNFKGTWNDFFDIIKADELIYGNWFDFTLGWWNLRHRDNVLVLKYEDMKADPEQMVREVAEFCEAPLTGDQLDTIVRATSFDTMKQEAHNKNKLRKGQTGDWKTHFTVAQAAYFDNIIETRLAGTGLDYQYE